MSKKRINALLWRSYLAATSAALWEQNKSQYYFELPRSQPDYVEFFGDQTVQSQDPQGNTAFTIQLEPFEGAPSVGGYTLKLTKLRNGVERAGNWQVLDQRGESAYPLWQKNRGPLEPFEKMDAAEKKRNFIIIARDVDCRFHGRWIRSEDFLLLPVAIQEILKNKSVGWSDL